MDKTQETDEVNSSQYAQSIIDTIREPLIVLDQDLRVISASRCFYQTFNLNKAQTEGAYFFELNNGQWNIPTLRDLLTRILPHQNVMDGFEVSHDFHSIGNKTMLLNARRLIRQSGQKELILLAMEDITDRKRAEDILKDESRRKNEFLASLAHELRGPVAPVYTGLQMLTQGVTKKENMGEMLQMMERQLVHVMRLIEDLSDISSIAEGKVELRLEMVNILEVSKDAIEALRPIIDQKKQEFVVSQQAQPMKVMGDPTRLNQIIFNLLNNAAKYTPEGGKITLLMRGEDHEVLIKVCDTGIGIAPEKKSKIFDLYMQTANAAQNYGGLGIGLALVKKLTEMHGGQVEVYSEGIGKGAEFTIRLPRLNNHEDN